MSYKKVQQLADKFANTSYDEDQISKNNKTDPHANNFLRKLRMALSELEGDLVVLKYRGFNKTQWKELGLFWRNCIEIYKAINEQKLDEGIQELADLVKDKKEWLIQMLPAIQKQLKETEVDFTPGPYLTQARADGLKELLKVINDGAEHLKKNTLQNQMVTWRPPPRNPSNSTFVSVKESIKKEAP